MPANPPPIPTTTAARKSVLPALLIGAFLCVLLSAAVGWGVVQGFRKLQHLRVSSAPKFAATDWASREVGELSLESPYPFMDGPDVESRIPEAARSMIVSMKVHQSQGSPASFLVMSSRVEYRDLPHANLDGAVNGAIQEAGKSLGDADPQFTAIPITIDGLPGRRATYHSPDTNRPLHIEAVFTAHSNRLWQTQVIYVDPASSPDADRILNSLKIRR
jgi:hypothetical protein